MKLEIKKSLFLALTLTATLAATFMPAKRAEAALSILSCANCASINESISWDPWAYNWLYTY